jgi:hypothetical protein
VGFDEAGFTQAFAFFLQEVLQIPGGLGSLVNDASIASVSRRPYRRSRKPARASGASLKELPEAVEVVFWATGEAKNAAKPCSTVERIQRLGLGTSAVL